MAAPPLLLTSSSFLLSKTRTRRCQPFDMALTSFYCFISRAHCANGCDDYEGTRRLEDGRMEDSDGRRWLRLDSRCCCLACRFAKMIDLTELQRAGWLAASAPVSSSSRRG